MLFSIFVHSIENHSQSVCVIKDYFRSKYAHKKIYVRITLIAIIKLSLKQ